MKRTYQEFTAFARAFAEQNCFDFDETELQQQPDPVHPMFFYDATYRDESNYKTNVRIHFDGLAGVITWEVSDGWEDAESEIETLYRLQFEKPRRQLLADKDKDAARVYRVLQQLMEGIHKAEAGKIPFAAVFNGIPIRDCLPQYTVMATTWNIDDIRDRLPRGTSKEELYAELQRIERGLTDAAIRGGWDVIYNEF
jgi:hypothetical protein